MALKYYSGDRITGTASDRSGLTTTNVLAGTSFLETDTNDLYHWDGSSWEVVASDTVAQTVSNRTLTTPTIAATGWANATHTHAADNRGGNIALGTATTGNYVGTITAGTGITSNGATSGEGIAHTLSIDASQTQITSVGTIGTGVWEGTTVAVAQGGTGATSLNNLITLSTHTTGNYVAAVAGTANEIEISGSGSEGATVTIGIPTNPTLGGNVTISGDLTVSGDTTQTDTATLTVEDPLIELARNNTGNAVDIGFYGRYRTNGTNLYTGLFWNADASKYALFHGNQAAPSTTVNISGTGYTVSTLIANLEGNITGTAPAGTLTGNTLASGVTASSLTSVGTLTDLTVSGTSTTIGTVTSGVWNAGAVTSSGAVTGTSLVAGNLTVTTSEIDVSSGDLTIDVAGSDVLLSAAYITPDDGYGIRWSSDVYIYGSSANAAEYIRMDVPAKSGAFYMDRAGNLGLGTTTPALNIGGQSAFDFTTGTHLHISDTTSGESAQLHLEGHAYAQITMSDQNGATDQKTFGMRTDGNRTDFKTLEADIGSGKYFLSMKHDTGHVGIGVTAPIKRLHVHEPTSSTSLYIRLSNATTGSGDNDGTDFGLGATGNLVLWNKENTAFHLATNNIERFHITAAGNVGVGTTAPASLFALGSARSAWKTINFQDNDNSNAVQAYVASYNTGASDGFLRLNGLSNIQFRTADSDRMYLNATGLGIGNTSPDQKLTVGGHILLTSANDADSSNKYSIIAEEHYDTDDEEWVMMSGWSQAASHTLALGGYDNAFNAATSMLFYTAANVTTRTGTLRMTIDASGDIIQHGASYNTKWDTSANEMIFYDGASLRFGTSGSGDMVLTHSSNANTLTLNNGLTVTGDGSSFSLLSISMSGGSGKTLALTCDNSGAYVNGAGYIYLRPDSSTPNSVQIRTAAVTMMSNTVSAGISSNPQLILNAGATGNNNHWTSIRYVTSTNYDNEDWYTGGFGHASSDALRRFGIARHDGGQVFAVNYNGNAILGPSQTDIQDVANYAFLTIRHNTNGGGIIMKDATKNRGALYNGDNGVFLDVVTDGYLDVRFGASIPGGTTEFKFEPDGDFHADGDVYAFSTTVGSDIALKKNITVIDNALDKVSQLKGVLFDWKREDRGSSAGLIAQDVEKILPQLVKETTMLNEHGSHKNLNYNGIIGLLVESIKELKDKIKDLENGYSR